MSPPMAPPPEMTGVVQRPLQIMAKDRSRAYFSAPARRQVFVELPDEDKADGENMVSEFNYSTYGTRDVAQHLGG